MIRITIDGKEYIAPDGHTQIHNGRVYLDGKELDIPIGKSMRVENISDELEVTAAFLDKDKEKPLKATKPVAKKKPPAKKKPVAKKKSTEN